MTSAYSLLCYTRKSTTREEANNADIALSMHLALRSHADGDFVPLNENYGIFFAAGVPSAAATPESRRACVAARRFGADLFDDPRPASDGVAHGCVMPDADIMLKSLKDPYLFRLKDGRFGIVAIRTARGGEPDGSERSSFLLAVSRDLRSFDRLGQVVLDTDGGVARPAVAWDDARGMYMIRWRDEAGRICDAAVSDIEAAAESATRIVPTPERRDGAIFAEFDALEGRDCGIPGAQAGNIIAVSEAEAQALLERFGRIRNTSAKAPCYTLDAAVSGGQARQSIETFAKAVVTLGYDDGSTAVRSVDWDESQLGALVADAEAGRLQAGQTYAVRGKIRQTRYPVPFAVERADPSVFAWNFNGEPLFLFIATDDTDGNCIDPNGGATHMPLRVADSVEALSDEAGGRAREIDLLSCGDLNSEGRAMTGCFWAPELHVIGGRLSILFMPCFDGEERNPDGSANERAGKPDMWTGCCHIMQLKQDEDGRDLDPREPANWTVPEPILGPEGETLNPVQRISLDMTVLTDSGRWYYLWQQVGSVWIATFDPSSPARLTSRPRQIIVPEFAWDNLIAEGPNAVVHEGRIYLIYSGSLVGIDYTTGLVSAPAGRRADLTDPAVWTKLDYPLQKSGLYNGQWQLGTGHGMWSHDEDGNLIYVFHNAEYDHGRYGGRDAQVRRVHWAADGMPVLDMQWAEELDPQYADITMEITIR